LADPIVRDGLGFCHTGYLTPSEQPAAAWYSEVQSEQHARVSPEADLFRCCRAAQIIISVMTAQQEVGMPTVVTINRPDVVALIEQAAEKLTAGNKTEAVSLAMRRLLEQHARGGTLFGAHPGSVRVRDGVDLITAGVDDALDAATGRELAR